MPLPIIPPNLVEKYQKDLEQMAANRPPVPDLKLGIIGKAVVLVLTGIGEMRFSPEQARQLAMGLIQFANLAEEGEKKDDLKS